MRLYYTPRSHYSRKVRMLMGGLHLATELVNVGNVAESNSALFGENPLMKVPTLVDGDKTIFDSDNIAQYLVRTYDRKDTFQVLTTKIDELNARSVMNGVMAAEVELIMAERTGKPFVDSTRCGTLFFLDSDGSRRTWMYFPTNRRILVFT
jgi:glutathione S-transferase